MRISTKFTYEDLEAIPPDRNRYEIIDGELIVTAAPIPLHQKILLKLAARLLDHAEKHQLGEVYVAPLDIVFSRSTVLEPDLLFISRDRLHIIGEKYLTGPPDLVVEVLSESTARLDRETKAKQYARYGVPEFWLIDPEGRTVEMFRLREGVYELAAALAYLDKLESPLFPGLTLPVSSLWES